MAQPDFMLFVQHQLKERRLDFRFVSTNDEIGQHTKTSSIDFPWDAEGFFETFFDEFRRLGEAPGAGCEAISSKLEGVGVTLFEELLPEQLRQSLWDIASMAASARTPTFYLSSNETWIPWELLRIAEPGAGVGEFLVKAFLFSRRLESDSQSESAYRPDLMEFPVRRIALLAPEVPGGLQAYPGMREEREVLLNLKYPRHHFETIPTDYEQVLRIMGSGNYDAWHYIGHGLREDGNPHLWQIQLEGTDIITGSDLNTASARRLGARKPLVFLNCCHSAVGGFSLTRTGGLAEAFIGAGAGGFIGTHWAVSDQAAKTFAAHFYRSFFDGRSIAEAGSLARDAVRKQDPRDPSWLAYAIYANPNACCRLLDGNEEGSLEEKSVPEAHVQPRFDLPAQAQPRKASQKSWGRWPKGRPLPPAPITPFVGRVRDLAALRGLLQEEEPIVAIQGMGGSGKSSLARQVAHHMAADFPGGVFWSELGGDTADASAVLRSWAESCQTESRGLEESPPSVEVMRTALADYVASAGRALIVFDDFRSIWTESINTLLDVRPAASAVLLTTRSEDLAYAVSAQVHSLDVLSEEESIDLLRRAGAVDVVQEGSVQAARLAELLGFLPLALQLAAKQINRRFRKPAWQLGQLIEEIRDRGAAETLELQGLTPGLRGALAVSYESLDDQERAVFRCLGIFEKARMGAHRVCDILQRARNPTGYGSDEVQDDSEAHGPTSDEVWQPKIVERILDDLVREAMAGYEEPQNGESFYSLHPLMHEYANYLARKDPAYKAMRSAHWAIWSKVFRIAKGLSDDMFERAVLSSIEEQIDCLDQGLRAAEELKRTHEIPILRGNRAILLQRLGKLDEAEADYREIRTEFVEMESYSDVAKADLYLGQIAQARNDYQAAEMAFQSSLEVAIEGGLQKIMHAVEASRAIGAQEQGKIKEAKSAAQRCLVIAKKELKDEGEVIQRQLHLGFLDHLEGKWADAAAQYADSLASARKLKREDLITSALHHRGELALLQGDYSLSSECYYENLKFLEESGDILQIANLQMNLGSLAAEQGEIQQGEYWWEKAQENHKGIENKIGVALCAIQLASMATSRDEYSKAQDQLVLAEEILMGEFSDSSFYESKPTAALWANQGILALKLGDFQRAEALILKAGDLFKKHALRLQGSQCNHFLATLRRRRGDLDDAWRCLNENEELYGRLGSRLPQGYTFGEMGWICRDRGDEKGADDFHRRSLSIFKDLDHFRAKAEAYKNLSRSARIVGDYEGAKGLCAKATRLLSEKSTPAEAADLQSEMGMIALAQESWDTASALLERSFAVYRERQMAEKEAISLFRLGRLARRRGTKTKARRFLLESLEMCKRMNLAREISLIHEELRSTGSMLEA